MPFKSQKHAKHAHKEYQYNVRTAFNSDILRAMRATNIIVGFNIRVKLGLIEHWNLTVSGKSVIY